jgi:hypothetical protein
MEIVQGAVIPRCYGWFEAELAEVQTFGSCTADKGSKTEGPNPESPFAKFSRLNKMSRSRNSVSVLLLERLGENLPVDVPISDELV